MVGIHEDTMYHIYAKDRCIYNCLEEEESMQMNMALILLLVLAGSVSAVSKFQKSP